MLRIYELLFRAEILEQLCTVTTGSHTVNEERAEFCHYTYRDFCVAKALKGKLDDPELLESILDKEIETLILLSGREPQQSLVVAIIIGALEKGKNGPCPCMLLWTRKSSTDARNRIEGEFRFKVKNLEVNEVIGYVWRHGERIAGMVFDLLEKSVLECDLETRIIWEIVKEEELGLEANERYRKTFIYHWNYCDSGVPWNLLS